MPLSKVEVVWGDTDRCPYSVGESGSRTTIMTGTAVVEAARDLKKQIAEKGMPTGDAGATSRRRRRIRGSRARSAAAFGAHFCEVEVDTELGDVRVTKYVAVHDSRPAHESAQREGPDPGRRHPGHRHGAARGHGLRPPHRPAADRLATTARASPRTSTRRTIEVTFIENDDGYGPYGAKSIGEAGIILAPAARRQRHLQRDRQAHEGHADHARPHHDALGALA